MEMVGILLDMKVETDFRAIGVAAQNSNIGLISYLREHNVEWNETACEAAISNGRFYTLMWLIHNGCPYSIDYKPIIVDFLTALKNDKINHILLQYEILEWTIELMKEIVNKIYDFL
jgi:hypothetical protein